MNVFFVCDSAKLFFAAVVCFGSGSYSATTDDSEKQFCATGTVVEFHQIGWPDVCKDAKEWLAKGDDHPQHDDEEEPPTPAALAAVERLASSRQMARPDVWGASGDGGFYIEQHDPDLITVIWIARDGAARLSVLNNGTSLGPSRLV